jgi:hypothetical protein
VRTLIGILVVILLGVTTLDRVACPDGCTDEPAGHSSAPAAQASICGLCQGWSAPAVSSNSRPAGHVALLDVSILTAERSAHPLRIEHPPKHA